MKLLLLLILPFLFLFTACKTDENAEERLINYPGSIAPEIIISRSSDSTGLETSSFEVWIYDKNRNGLEIIDGSVSINGFQLVPYRYTVDNIPYYTLPDSIELDFEINETYACTITLSNGRAFESSVHTQSAGLDTLFLPAVHSADSSLAISWQRVDSTAEMLLEAWYYYQFNNQSGWGKKTYLLGSGSSSQYTIGDDLFSIVPGIRYIDFRLSSTLYGVTHPEFDERSRILSVISRSRRVTIQ